MNFLIFKLYKNPNENESKLMLLFIYFFKMNPSLDIWEECVIMMNVTFLLFLSPYTTTWTTLCQLPLQTIHGESYGYIVQPDLLFFPFLKNKIIYILFETIFICL